MNFVMDSLTHELHIHMGFFITHELHKNLFMTHELDDTAVQFMYNEVLVWFMCHKEVLLNLMSQSNSRHMPTEFF